MRPSIRFALPIILFLVTTSVVPQELLAATASYVGDTTSTTGASTYTFTNHAIGTAAADRKVIVVVQGIQNGTSALSPTVTIGGNAASAEVVANGDVDIFFGRNFSGIYSLDVPSGTTATIVVNFGGTMYDATVFVYAANGLQGAASDTASAAGGGTASPADVSVDVANGGIIIGGASSYDHSSPGATWSGATKDDFATLYSNDYRSVASYSASSAETPRAVTVTFPTFDNNHSYSVVSAAYTATASSGRVIRLKGVRLRGVRLGGN